MVTSIPVACKCGLLATHYEKKTFVCERCYGNEKIKQRLVTILDGSKAITEFLLTTTEHLRNIEETRPSSAKARSIAHDRSVLNQLALLTRANNALAEKIHTAYILAGGKGKDSFGKRGKVRPTQYRKVSVSPKLANILIMKEKGWSLEETARSLKISRSRVLFILKTHGFSTSFTQQPYYGITSETMERRRKMLAELAFNAGVSIATYVTMRNKLGRDRFSRLRMIMTHCQRNVTTVKKFRGDHESFFQLSVYDLLEFYTEQGKNLYPDEGATQAFDLLTKKDSGYMLIRVDQSKPYTRDNIALVTRQEFGHRLGVEHGWHAHNKTEREFA